MTLLTKLHIKRYLSMLQQLVLELTENPDIKEVPGMAFHISELILKTVPNREVLHGLATTLSYLHLAKNYTDEDLTNVYIVGWCLQMHATCYLISDDLFDQSKTRHYKPCWYLLNNKQYAALSDALLLEGCVFRLLQQHFSEKPYYPKMVEIFQKSQMKIAYATHFELSLSDKAGVSDPCEILSMKNYETCVKYKMSYYPTYIHVLMAMLLAGVPDPEKDIQAKNIFSRIDFHFQVRDDYLDVFGDNTENEAETGNDIELGRCTWNVCTALNLLNPVQQKELLRNYGVAETGNESSEVVNIYKSLLIPKIFMDYEEKEFHEIMQLISQLKNSENTGSCVPESLFIDMMWASFPKSRFLNGQEEGKGGSLADLKVNAEIYFDFMSTFPDVVNLGLEAEKSLSEKSNSNKYFRNVIVELMHYNMIPGKKSRGLIVAKVFRTLANNPTQSEIWKSNVLGWCVEMLQAAAVIADDVMDCGHLRRSRPCWYKLPNVGNTALNHALFLEALVYQILETAMGNEKKNLKIMSLFQDTIYKTAYGQQLDVLTAKEMKLEIYTEELYKNLVKYKTSYYTFVLPVVLGLIMAGITEENVLEEAKNVCLQIGYYFQAYDDYLDVFEDVSKTGKMGTDIAEGKCTWLFVNAIKEADEKTKSFIYKNYSNKENMNDIIQIYKSIGVPQMFEEFKENSYTKIKQYISFSKGFSSPMKDVFYQILDSTFGKNS